jgi:hypothetical protein
MSKKDATVEADIVTDWESPEIAKQLTFIKFCLENGGVSTTRSVDDAKSIIRYFHSQVEMLVTTAKEAAYKTGYAAGNAKKNYHRKGSNSKSLEDLDIRLRSVEIQLSGLLQSANDETPNICKGIS